MSKPRIRIACANDSAEIICLINAVAAERRYLQTDHYCPTPLWEQVLGDCLNVTAGLLLMVVEIDRQIIGYGRLTPDEESANDRLIGNVGIALLPHYRSKGIGSLLLSELITLAPKLGYRKLNAYILGTNHKSLTLFQKYGFAEVNRSKIQVPFEDQPVIELLVESHLAD